MNVFEFQFSQKVRIGIRTCICVRNENVFLSHEHASGEYLVNGRMLKSPVTLNVKRVDPAVHSSKSLEELRLP